MAGRFPGFELDPIVADSGPSDDDISPIAANGSSHFGRPHGRDMMQSTWHDEQGQIKVSEKGVRVLRADSGEEVYMEQQINPDDLDLQGPLLGRGACSVVNMATHLDTGVQYAVKVFSLLDHDKRRQLDREIRTLMRSLQGDCLSLVEFHGAFKRPDGKIYVVLEYMDRGSLQDLINFQHMTSNGSRRYTSSYEDGDGDVEGAATPRRKQTGQSDEAWPESGGGRGLPEGVVAAICLQICQGLEYLHANNQLHRDIKPSNILLNQYGEVKLTDFGIARELDHAGAMVDTVVGTVRYMSPERLRGDAYGWAADVWSLGVLLLECVTEEQPYHDGCSQIEILQTLKEFGSDCLLPPEGKRDHLSAPFLELVRSCLRLEPQERATPQSLLQSAWLTEMGVPNRDAAVEIVDIYLESQFSAAT